MRRLSQDALSIVLANAEAAGRLLDRASLVQARDAMRLTRAVAALRLGIADDLPVTEVAILEQAEDLLDAAEADEILADMRRSGEKPLPFQELVAHWNAVR